MKPIYRSFSVPTVFALTFNHRFFFLFKLVVIDVVITHLAGNLEEWLVRRNWAPDGFRIFMGYAVWFRRVCVGSFKLKDTEYFAQTYKISIINLSFFQLSLNNCKQKMLIK
jgi:hypothetical protein